MENVISLQSATAVTQVERTVPMCSFCWSVQAGTTLLDFFENQFGDLSLSNPLKKSFVFVFARER